MICENIEKGGLFSTLFNDFWKLAESACRQILPQEAFYASPDRYGYLANYAQALFNALAAQNGNVGTREQLLPMFSHFWQMTKQFINCPGIQGVRPDAYWDLVTGAVDVFHKKFPGDLPTKMALAFLDELDSRDRYERHSVQAMCA